MFQPESIAATISAVVPTLSNVPSEVQRLSPQITWRR